MSRSTEKRRNGKPLVPVVATTMAAEDFMDSQPPRSRPGSSKPPSDEYVPEDSEPSLLDSSTDESTSLSDDESHQNLGSTRVMDNAAQAAAADATPMGQPAPHAKPAEPTVLGDYRIIKKLGEGAMGAVYQAHQESFNRIVALKVLFPHVAKVPKLVDRLHREGRVMGALDHENLVQAYGIGEDKGYHFVAMEFVDGDSLQNRLNRLGKLSVGDAVHIALACARALEYAHNLNLVHRDIKPDNILITRTGLIKVADLGMVKTLDEEELGLTQTGHAVGTPWYMPLEQARNAKETDGRCDIYALGCMLYCMLTGSPPFSGKTLVEVIQAKEVGSFPPARQANPEVPERLDLILLKMIAKQAKYRYQTCGEVISDLEGLGLASAKLTFLDSKKTQRKTAIAMQPPVTAAATPSLETATDLWYLRIRNPDGVYTLRKLTTAQIKKMLEQKTVKPTAQASRQPEDGFRSLAAYREFESTALAQQTKKAADAHSARYRNIYKQAEDKDRKREEKAEREEAKAPMYYSGLLKPALIVGGSVVGVVIVLYVLVQLFR